MPPATRLITAIATPVALLATASIASAGLLGGMRDQKVYPTVLDTDNASYVDVAVRWAPHLLRRPGSSHSMRITLTGVGRRGAPLKFTKRTLRHRGKAVQVVRLTVPRRARGAYRNARHVVVSTAHHVSPTAGRSARSSAVAVSNATVAGVPGRTQFSARVVRDCDVATLGPNSVAPGCDFTGANLAGANLSNANLSNTILDNANLAGADLSNANVGGASMVGTNIAGANFGATSQAAFTMPQAANPSQGTSAVCRQTGGGPMCEAIYSATSTVGAVYYQFAGPNVTRWLQDALLRGVDVFVIENSANTTPGSNPKAPLCQYVSAWDPQCAWSPKADPFYAMEAQLKSVVKSDGSTGQVRVQFSSQNFNITHQKSILVDVLDASGAALDSAAIQAQGGFAIISTGNLQAFPNAWGQRTLDGTLANPDYLANPAATCPQGDPSKCDKEWTPRDFAMRVTDPAILARVAGVYASDLRCDASNVTNVQSRSSAGVLTPGLIADPRGSDPISAQWPETWSNGSTYYAGDPMPPGQQAWNYPAPGLYPNGYFAYGSSTFPTTPTYLANFLTGNVRARQVALIRAATKTLVVYNEEMSDFKKPYGGKPIDVTAPSIVNALIGAGQRGVKVTIVMANDFWTPTPGGPSVPDTNAPSWASSFNALTNPANFTTAGAVVPTIQLLDEDGALYIHAKAIIADGVDGWFGSINASSGSMNTNRELGLGVTSRRPGATPYIPAAYSPQMIAAVTTAAASDAAAGTSWLKGQPRSQPPSSPYIGSAQFPCINRQQDPTSGLPPRNPANPAAPPQAGAAAARSRPGPSPTG